MAINSFVTKCVGVGRQKGRQRGEVAREQKKYSVFVDVGGVAGGKCVRMLLLRG